MRTILQDNESTGHNLQDQDVDRVGLGAQSRLPADICDTILQFATKPTLLACSRVSRAWRELSRPHLFRFIKVARSYSYDDFLQFLEENADIARYIRTLTLGYASPLPRPTLDEIANTKPVVDRSFLVTLAEKIPYLQELSLVGILLAMPTGHDKPSDILTPATALGISSTPEITNNSRFGSFRLRRLLIVNCHCIRTNACHIPTLVDIISALPVDTVQTRDVYISSSLRYSLGQIPSITEGQLNIHALLMDANPFRAERHIRYLYNALRRAMAPRCLRKLRLDHIDRASNSGLRSLGELLHHAGGDTMRELELPFVIEGAVGLSEDHPEHWSVLHLDECRNIEALKISLRLDKYGPVPRVPYSAVCNAILAHVASTLRRLTIALLLVYGDEQIECNQTLCWGALDDVLEERFPALEVVRLEMQVRDEWLRECAKAASEAMPKSSARGILGVTQWQLI